MAYSTVKMVRSALMPTSAQFDGTNPPDVPSNTAADLTNDQIQDQITEADSFIDGFIGRFYTVPVAAVGDVVLLTPHPIDYWSRNVAAYNATLTYRGSLDFTDDDPVARRYTATFDALQRVAAGTVALQLPRNVSDSAVTGAGAAYNPYIGDLWGPEDFNLRPANFDPTYGPRPIWYPQPGYPSGGW